MKYFSIIVATDLKNGIGIDNSIPWHLPRDLKHFKLVTSYSKNKKTNAIIMGRRTWESLPVNPLPDRLNAVISRNSGMDAYRSLDQALTDLFQKEDVDEIFVIGGAMLYAEAIKNPLCKYIHLTKIESEFDCDVFIPSFRDEFNSIFVSKTLHENNLSFSYELLKRKDFLVN
jgi:dihydrofolate reductase